MAKRGEETTVAVPVEEVPAPAGDFPVSADSAPAESTNETESSRDDDPASADAGEPVEGDAAAVAPVEGVEEAASTPVNPFDVRREFRKHYRTGDIVAVELVGGMLQGIRHCTKPEYQTAGALPVMEMESRESDVGRWYRNEALNFKSWEPPYTPKLLMDKLMLLYEERVEVTREYDYAKGKLKAAKEAVEDVDERIFKLLQKIHDVPVGQRELPLEDDAEAVAAEKAADPSEPELPLEPEPVEEPAAEEEPLGLGPNEDIVADGGCETCGSTGYICQNCKQADGECTCTADGPDLVPCPEDHDKVDE